MSSRTVMPNYFGPSSSQSIPKVTEPSISVEQEEPDEEPVEVQSSCVPRSNNFAEISFLMFLVLLFFVFIMNSDSYFNLKSA